eukprot:CAMPEP_0173439000 /NCGR_PEP_ID=MMETSP1357-20121228/20716_1 /TAXON_ID=77926 /ORGANISM="Hemiselmis rufescens, Strain PCC563" /LENGTH=335 /DNA_ID=CAMNT_0014404333 /DNA_START=75 /DNA_END=1079 /DNA_ORIENTATION=-
MEFSLVQGYLDVRSLAMSKLVCKGWVEHATYLQASPHFVTALSTAGDIAAALSDVISHCSSSAFSPNIAFLFLSDYYLTPDGGSADLSSAASAIEAACKGTLPPSLAIVGCTGSGIIGQHGVKGVVEIEHGSSPAVSLALAHITNCDIKALSITTQEQLDAYLSDLRESFADTSRGEKCVRAVCLADVRSEGTNDRLEALLEGTSAACPTSEVTGGLASAARGGRSFTYTRPSGSSGAFTKDALACALLSTSSSSSSEPSPSGAATDAPTPTPDAAAGAKGKTALPLTHACVARNVISTGHKYKVVKCTKDPEMEVLREMNLTNIFRFETLAAMD